MRRDLRESLSDDDGGDDDDDDDDDGDGDGDGDNERHIMMVVFAMMQAPMMPWPA